MNAYPNCEICGGAVDGVAWSEGDKTGHKRCVADDLLEALEIVAAAGDDGRVPMLAPETVREAAATILSLRLKLEELEKGKEGSAVSSNPPAPSRYEPAVTLTWRMNGAVTHHLFAGKLYAGSVYRLVAPNWRETNTMKENSPYFRHNERHEDNPWRAWFMHDEDGDAVGYFETLDEAKSHLAEYTAASLTAGPVAEPMGGQLEPITSSPVLPKDLENGEMT